MEKLNSKLYRETDQVQQLQTGSLPATGRKRCPKRGKCCSKSKVQPQTY